MEILIKILQFILSLTILVLIHEMGHFMFAKLFKTRVEKFYLFFNPWFSLYKHKKGDTTYGIGWLPLGGYVKIAGMIDESMDREQMKKPPQPWEFRSKPVYQRFLIMIGGVLFNFILAIAIFSMMLMHWGEQYLAVKDAKYGIYCDSLALSIGLKHGDMIEKVGTHNIEKFNDILMSVLLEDGNTITVLRAGKREIIAIPEQVKQEIIAHQNQQFVMPFIPFIIDSILQGNPAQEAHLMKGDHIVALNDIQTPAFFDFAKLIKQYKNQKVPLSFIRNGEQQTVTVVVNAKGQIGVGITPPEKLFKLHTTKYSFLQSIPAGIAKGFETLGNYVRQLKLVFTAEGVKQIGGFGTIGSLFPTTWDWEIFWGMTAFLSIILAFMNFLPIPALDGGHIMFLVYEFVTGKKPDDKFLERAQIIGMGLLLTLLVYANLNDVFRFFMK